MNSQKLYILISLIVFSSTVLAQTKYGTESDIKKVVDDTNRIYTNISPPPTYPGGLDSFKAFAIKGLKIPAIYINGKARLFTWFIIQKTGKLIDIKIIHRYSDDKLWSGDEPTPDKKFDEAVKEKIRHSPMWNPALLKAKPVRAQYVVKIF